MEETFAYLKEVLGVRYLPLNYAAVMDSPEGYESLQQAAALAQTGEIPVSVEEGEVAATIEAPAEETVEQTQDERSAVNELAPVEIISDSSKTGAPGFGASASVAEPDSNVIADPDATSTPITPAKSPGLSASLDELEKLLGACARCKLNKTRKNIVFGKGPAKAKIMFVGEGPGEQEDLQGEPFVGPAGQLLTKMISAMGLSRDEVYITNVVKCRPPMNRNPEPDEIHECSPFLKMQIKLVDPKIIVALGTFAAQTLLQTDDRIGKLRGKILDYDSRKLIATFHPSYLLRTPSEKKAAWEDLKLAMEYLGLSGPSQKS